MGAICSPLGRGRKAGPPGSQPLKHWQGRELEYGVPQPTVLHDPPPRPPRSHVDARGTARARRLSAPTDGASIMNSLPGKEPEALARWLSTKIVPES